MKKDLRIESIKRLEDDYHIFWEAWLRPGWCWGDQGLHVWHEDTKKEILENIWQIKKCNCPQCKKG